MAWAPCAPVFVDRQLAGILARSGLLDDTRRRVESLRAGLTGTTATGWSCRFPVLAGPGAPPGAAGGILTVTACDPGVHPPRGAQPLDRVLDCAELRRALGVDLADMFVAGLPADERAVVLGRSGTAAVWLACQSRRAGRRIPDDVVVSADLVAGPGGAPRLGPVDGGDAKADVVNRECAGARLLLCGPHGAAPKVVRLEPGAAAKDLEHLVWGTAATTDRGELGQVATTACSAFDDHDYARAAPRYEVVVAMARPEDGELLLEACLRLATIAVHQGRPQEAAEWFARADQAKVPKTKSGRYTVERLGALAGMYVDRFEPTSARKLLECVSARRAADPEHTDDWERIQVLGAWRRLHLLEGAPRAARAEQVQLYGAADEAERPRALIDLAWTEIRCGDLEAARRWLLAARRGLLAVPEMYRLQTRAFLAWHVGRLAARDDPTEELDDLLDDAAIGALLAEATLQAAPRWRLEALRAVRRGQLDDIGPLAARCTSFQRWHLGVFLLECDGAFELAARTLRDAEVDLAGMPALAEARERLASGWDEGAVRVLMTNVAY